MSDDKKTTRPIDPSFGFFSVLSFQLYLYSSDTKILNNQNLVKDFWSYDENNYLCTSFCARYVHFAHTDHLLTHTRH